MKKAPVLSVLLAAVLLPIGSLAATVRLDAPLTPVQVGSAFDVDVLVDEVLSPDEVIAFGFDIVKSSSWRLDEVEFGTGFSDDSARFPNTDVAGSAFPGVTGTDILLATLQFTPSLAGTFSVVVFSDTADPNEGLFVFSAGQFDLTSLAKVQVVPIPAALPLLVAGLIGLVGFVRRKAA